MAKTCHSCPQLRSCLVGALDKRGRKIFSDALQRYSVQGKGRALFNQGEPADCCYFLCDGAVKFTRVLQAGHEVILDVRKAPAALGKAQTLKQPVHFQSIVTITKSVSIGRVETKLLLDLLRDYPVLLQNALNQLAGRLEILYKMLACMKLRVRDRLLCMIALTLSSSGEDDVIVPLSNIELAQLAQTTPETISRTIRQLHAESKLDIGRGTLKIKKQILQKALDQLC